MKPQNKIIVNELQERINTLTQEMNDYSEIIKLKQVQINSLNDEIHILSQTQSSNVLNNKTHFKNIFQESSAHSLLDDTDIYNKSDLSTFLKEYPLVIEYKKGNGKIKTYEITLNLDFARDFTSNPELEFFSSDSSKKRNLPNNIDELIYVYDLLDEKMKYFTLSSIIEAFIHSSNL